MSGDRLDLDAIEARMAAYQHILDTARYDEDLMGELAGDVWPLVAEVRRLRHALEVIAGDDLDYSGRLRLTEAENAIYVIARDALGRPA